MKYYLTILTFTLLTSSYAGPGGGHSHGHSHSKVAASITQEKTIELGMFHVKRLVKSKKIDSTWLKSEHDKSVVVKNEWLVTFKNTKGVKGKTLYIFLTKSGKFVAANFSGK